MTTVRHAKLNRYLFRRPAVGPGAGSETRAQRKKNLAGEGSRQEVATFLRADEIAGTHLRRIFPPYARSKSQDSAISFSNKLYDFRGGCKRRRTAAQRIS